MASRTPLFERHVAAGARMVEFAGFEMPIQYAGIKEEHLAVRSAAGLFDVSHMGELRVSGPDALKALQWLVSNDVAALEVGEAGYGCLCNHEGGVVDDVFTYRLAEDDFMVCVNAANRVKDAAWFAANLPEGDITYRDEGDAWAQLAVQGPKAEAILEGLTSIVLANVERRHFALGTVAGVDGCIVARTGYTGEDGFEIFAPAAGAVALWDAILVAGEAHGIVPVGLGARDTLRLEAGNCLYGHELTDETTPLQARLGWVCALDKPGGFLGSSAIEARKPTNTHRLASLVVHGKRIPRDGMPILADGEVVGHVTSGTRAPSLERGIALAYLLKGHGRPGTRLVIDCRGRPAEAEVISGPFLRQLA